jgi:hypothetical protein
MKQPPAIRMQPTVMGWSKAKTPADFGHTTVGEPHRARGVP